MKPYEYVKPTTWSTAITEQGGTIQFNTETTIKGGAGTDAAAYVKALTDGLDEYFNGGDWEEGAEEAIPCEFRPKGTEPTTQQIVLMQDRSVEFDPRKSIYDDSTFTKGEAVAGDFLFCEATPQAALFSFRQTFLDHHIMSGFTLNGLTQTAEKLLKDFEMSCGATIAKILTTSSSTEVKALTGLSKNPRERAEDIIDGLTMNINQAVGASLSDFVLLIPAKEVAGLERAAQRAGLSDVEDLLGCGSQFYSGEDLGIFMLPKGMASLSFRKDSNGAVWQIHATRNPNAMAWDVEVIGVADVVTQAKVQLKLAKPADPKEKLQVELVDFPMVTRVTLAD